MSHPRNSEEFSEDFLRACAVSSAETCARFESLLARLDREDERSAALADLRAIGAAYARRSPTGATHFSFTTLELPQGPDEFPSLRLLQLPSVFAPEEWSFTFFEGLTRLPASYFDGVTLAELGCGNGWISMALALRSAPARVLGLDINPRAILSARINLYLNAFDEQGQVRLVDAGRSLLDLVEFHTSDLLTHCIQREIRLDRVIGCIPQVLNPDLEGSIDALSDQTSDEFLYSLSNYCGKQGYIEDQFGLGLMARVLEEVIETMRPRGRVVFNMGGRPGEAVLRRLFERRGFTVDKVWQSRVAQAQDTDILTLVEIERHSPHRFEFFMGMHAEQAIGAQTAQAYAAAGGAISHSISVYEARLAYPAPVKHIFSLLRRGPFREVQSALDLSFEQPPIAEEKTAFLADLAQSLAEPTCFPYEETEGSTAFRSHLAKYLQDYFLVPLGPEALLTLPSRAYALSNLVHLHRPRRVLCDRELLLEMPTSWAASIAETGGELIEGPGRADLSCKLISCLRPDMVITTLADFERRTTDPFSRLIEHTEAVGARLVVDISSGFELASAPQKHGVLTYLAERRLPAHVAVLCGLVRGKVYADLELSFLLSEDRRLLDNMTFAAELTYSRAPILAQRYYQRILADLLSFRMRPAAAPDLRLPTRVEPEVDMAEPHEGAVKAFAHPALDAHHLAVDDASIRLDYGENALPTPTVVRVRLFEAFARQHLSDEEVDARPSVVAMLNRRFGLGDVAAQEIVLGSGVAPLFESLIRACAQERATLVLPRGVYGYFTAVAEFFCVPVRWIETTREADYKARPEQVEAALLGVERPWMYLNGPASNPTGAIYSGGEINALLSLARDRSMPVILDTIFAGLEFPGEETAWSLRDVLERRGPTGNRLELALLGGISKELAAGGLRLGHAYGSTERLRQLLRAGSEYSPPHRTLTFAFSRVFADLQSPSEQTRRELFEQRLLLQSRARALAEVLRECGWTPLESRGGLFMVAAPSAYLGVQVEVEGGAGRARRWTLDATNIAEALFVSTGLLINNDIWTGIPGHCRFVLSVEQDQFNAALLALRAFRDQLGDELRTRAS